MNKIIWISAAVLSVAACAKNEVVPVNSGENQEITFNVAPKTKADLDEHEHTEFGKDNVFASWAYYLPGTVKWDKKDGDNTTDPITPATTPALYIDGAEISNTKPDGTDGVWKAKNTYYWPKNGSLTFFAYSLNKKNLDLTGGDSHLGCDVSTGINGAIDLKANPNTDFLVAEIAKDQTSNVQTHFTNGVPTLFKHRLSSVVFAIKTGANYPDKKFQLTSITLHNLSHYATYNQLATKPFVPGGSDKSYAPEYTSTIQDITNQSEYINVKRAENNIFIFIPQTFAKGSDANQNAYIEVKYTITTKVGTDEQGADIEVKENVTKQIFLNPENGKGTKMFDEWEMGKKYTINLTFTLDEILWDPAVQDWEGVNIGTDTKPIIVG